MQDSTPSATKREWQWVREYLVYSLRRFSFPRFACSVRTRSIHRTNDE